MIDINTLSHKVNTPAKSRHGRHHFLLQGLVFLLVDQTVPKLSIFSLRTLNDFFFPIPLKLPVESQPVRQWNDGSTLQIFPPSINSVDRYKLALLGMTCSNANLTASLKQVIAVIASYHNDVRIR